MAYAEFATTTNFSFLRGASHPEELVAQAMTLGLAGIGIADRNSLAGVVIALDRMERGQGEVSAVQEVNLAYSVPGLGRFRVNV